ncbi:MAG TPA: contractile injection system tape measure protein [Bacteroidia bacterium]|nr:contractile injection system tape measure protein [Bacteroidia bacterium]
MNKNVINRQIIDLKVSSQKNAFRLQQQVNEIYHAEILPMLDDVMSGLIPENEVLRIDRLEIDLGALRLDGNSTQLTERLRSQISDQLKTQLLKASVHNGVTASTEQDEAPALVKETRSALDLLDYFFSSGSLPWWAGDELQEPDINRMIILLLEKEPVSLLQLLQKTAHHPVSARRLVLQTETRTRSQLLSFFSSSIRILQQQLQVLRKITRNDTAVLVAAGHESEVLLLAVLLSGESAATGMLSKETAATALIRANAFVAGKKAEAIESRLYMHIVNAAAKDEKTEMRETGLLPYFLEWEKKHRGTVIHSSGDPVLPLAKWVKEFTGAPATKTAQEAESISKKKHTRGRKKDSETAPAENKANAVKKNEHTGTEDAVKEKRPMHHSDENVQVFSSSEEENEFPGGDSPAGMTRYGGLVLIAPFLPAFFSELKLLKENSFTDDAAKYKAVHLLHYIATGKTKAQEYSLMLHKLLCGMKISDPVPKSVRLSRAEKKEAMVFLDDIAEQWTALRTTSGEMIRNTFMRRNGIIEKKDGAWLVRIERGAVDIILNTLPWNISIFKAPWTQQLLHIEW